MSESPDPVDRALPPTSAPPPERRIAFERLRERTDELELLVSGLTVFALFAAPGLIVSLWERNQLHLDGTFHSVAMLTCQFAIGLCYALAFTFLFHIVVRAYWIGLIGLKSAFPGGIRWDAARNLGPLSREFFQRRVPDLDSAIDSADRMASVVFAMAGLIAITIVWIASLIGVLVSSSALIVWALDLPDSWAARMAVGLSVVAGLLGSLNWLLDTKLAARRPDLAQQPWFRRWLLRSIWLGNAFLPQRLILPVQLTLQSNWNQRRFMLVMFLLFAAVPMAGTLSLTAGQQFAPLNNYDYLDGKAVEGGLRSAHYENLRSPNDSALNFPTIPSDRIAEAYLRLFLPHLPGRDNAVLAQRCGVPAEQGDARQRAACAAGVWQVRLDGAAIDNEDFVPAERRDLGMRGFQAYLPMAGLAPGRHDLEVVWHAEGPDSGLLRRRVFHIPFWLSPGYELSVP